MENDEKETNPGSDPKFQRFAASIERALKGFEVSKEWQDLISCLTRLNKVLLAYVHFHVLPHKQLICRRLSQCLHPSLPGGVHLKVLDVYKVIFDRIGHDGLAKDLFLYSSGLFPLLEYGSMTVKPVLLDLYEQYYIPLGLALLSGLSGIMSALLPGLEEGSEHNERVTSLLDVLCTVTRSLAFIRSLWNILFSSSSLRLPALTYILSRIQSNKDDNSVYEAIKQFDCPELAASAICSSLQDSNILVQRSMLDVIIQLFPLHSLPISEVQLIRIIMATCQCLLKRDQSIIRRVMMWLLGKTPNKHKDTDSDSTVDESVYFITYVKPHLLVAYKQLLLEASTTSEKSLLTQPYRLLKLMYDQSEMTSIVPEVIPDLLQCLRSQINQFGGQHSSVVIDAGMKKVGKRGQLKGELLYSANQVWMTLDSDLLWGWIEGYLSQYIKNSSNNDTCTVHDRIELVLFLLKVLPLMNMEGALSLYLPNVLLHLAAVLNQSLQGLSLQDIYTLSTFIVNCLTMLQQCLQVTNTSEDLPTDASPSTERKYLHLGKNPIEGSKNTLGGLVMALLQQSQALIQTFVSTHICDMEDVSSVEMITVAIKEGLQSVDVSKTCKNNGYDLLGKSLSTLCTVLMNSLYLLHFLGIPLSGQSSSSLAWIHALILVPLHTNDLHLLLSSLRFLLQLWEMATARNKGKCAVSIECINDLLSRRDLLQVFTLLLWSLLSPFSSCYHHEEAASLLSLLFTLAPSSIPLEGFILETFNGNSILPYQQFSMFWKYLLQQRNIPELKLQRLILRMIEGLHNHNPAIQQCTSSWLVNTSKQHYLHSALIPLYSLIKGACPSKIKAQKEEPDKEIEPHAKYCYASINKEVEEKPFISPYPSFYFSKLVDTARYNYGLGLFQSVISTNPELICTELANSHTQIPEQPSEGSSRRPSEAESPDDTSVITIKSLLELILSDCMELISSDYPHWLNTSNAEQLSLCEVKIASTSVAILLLASITKLLSLKCSSNGEMVKSVNIHNPSYVKGLLTLCEVQKATLIALLNLLGPFIESKDTVQRNQMTQSTISSPVEFSLVLHLLKCLNYQLIIESVTAVESPVPSTNSEEPLILQYVPGNSLSSQPMFHLLVQCVFTQASNIDILIPFLLLIKSSLSYFTNSLESIAPKVLKLSCRNISLILKEKSTNSCDSCSSLHVTNKQWPECTCHVNCELLVCYIETIISLVHYCLLLSPTPSLSHSLHYQMLDIFWDISSISTPDLNTGLQSPHLTPSASHEKRSFGLSWIFGNLFGTGNGTSHENDQVLAAVCTSTHHRGVGTPAGQKVLWLLHYVYSTLTQLWKCICCEGCQVELAQDIKVLINQCLNPLLVKNDVLYYSSIAQTWMHWSLNERTKKQTRDTFIEMSHSFKFQPIENLLSSICATLINMSGDEDIKASEERQKYLLDFLYHYISSPCQSSDELITCSVSVVTFLKDCHNTITTGGVEVGYHGNTPLLCMLASILHVFVCRVPVPDLKTNKKQRRELQDIIYRLCDSLSQTALSQVLANIESHQSANDNIASSSSSSPPPPPLSRPISEDQRKKGNREGEGEKETNHLELESSSYLPLKSSIIQQDTAILGFKAMAVLSNVLSHFVDCVYESSEKDRVTSLLKAVLRCVWPTLHNYNVALSGCYIYAVRLIASLSGFQVTRKCWKDEVMECFLNSKFFVMDEASIKDWKIIIDNLMSQDKLMFKSLLIRIPSSSAAGMVNNMFSSLELERVQRAKLFKRMAFVILSGERGQYSYLLQDIQDKLLDSVRWYSGPILNAQVLSTFRVLLVKLSAEDLASIWPALLSELTTALSELHSDLSLELATPLKTSQEKLSWYYNACKILHTALSLPLGLLPQFQVVSWGYFGESKDEIPGGMIGDILTSYKKDTSEKPLGNPIVPQFHEVKTAVDLVPFLHLLSMKAKRPSQLQINQLEELMLLDFVEHNQK